MLYNSNNIILMAPQVGKRGEESGTGRVMKTLIIDGNTFFIIIMWLIVNDYDHDHFE